MAEVTPNSSPDKDEATVTSIESPPVSRPSNLPFNPTWRFNLAFWSLMVLSLMASLDATSLSVAIPTIVTALHGTAIQGFWTGTSFLLASTVGQPIWGSLSTVFGRKSTILASILFFAVGAIVAATTPKNVFSVLLAARALQGFGGGGILVLIDVVITDTVPLRFRGNYFSLLGVMWAIGSVSGPIVGGALAEMVSWRWIFWINLPIVAVGAPLVVMFLKLHFRATSLMHKLTRIDWVGGALFMGSMTAFLIGISWGGVNHPWSSWQTLVPLIIGGAGLLIFVLWEDRFAAEPLIRTIVVKNRTSALAYLGGTIQGITLWAVLYYLPLYFQATKGTSQITTGVALLPGTLTVAPSAILTGRLITHSGQYKWAIQAGWVLTTLGFGLQTLLTPSTPTASWVAITLWTGIGNGLLYPSLIYAIQAACSDADQAYGVSLYNFFRTLGQTVGVAVGGAVFQNAIEEEIEGAQAIARFAKAWSLDASGLVLVLRALPSGSTERRELERCYAAALRTVWIVMAALSGVALVACWGVKHFDLDRGLETEQGFVYEGTHEETGEKEIEVVEQRKGSC